MTDDLPVPTKEITEVQDDAGQVVLRAMNLEVVDTDTLQRAEELMSVLKELRQKAETVLAEPKKHAYDTHRSICDLERQITGPITEQETRLRKECGSYRRKLEREREQAERELRRRREQARLEAERAAEEERRRRIEEARQRKEEQIDEALNDDDIDRALHLDEQPDLYVEPDVQEPEPEPEPEPIPETENVSYRDKYSARVVDLHALVQAVASDGHWATLNLLKADEKALRDLAKATKGSMPLPGVEWVHEKIPVVR